jgi:hypothetical protein
MSALTLSGARGGAVGSGTALQAGTWLVRFPIRSLAFFIDIILSGTMALGSTQPVRETSTRNISCRAKATGA